MVRKPELKKALLYNTTRYHALVNPAGVATHIGTPHVCLNIFHEIRFKRIPISDADGERALLALDPSGWQIVPVRMAIFSDDVTNEEIEKIGKPPYAFL